MGQGTIRELDKLAGEPVDIHVKYNPIEKREAIVIGPNSQTLLFKYH